MTYALALALLALALLLVIAARHRKPDPYEGLGMLDQQDQHNRGAE